MILIILKAIFSKETLKLLPFIFLALLILALYGLYSENQSLQGQVRSYKSLEQEKSHMETFQDNQGDWHSKTEPAVIESGKVLKALAKSDSNMIILKNQVTGLKKDLRNLSSANVIGSTTTVSTEGDLRDSMGVLHDTLKVLYQKLDKVTPWLEQHIEIVNGKLKEKEIIHDTIFVSAYTEKKWFLGKSHLKVEAFSRNPDAKVVIDQSIIVNRRKGGP